ncbi:MAG: hypothetical protein BroJett010_11720 [Gammaproteobacteria bacterium]|nr:hypothetical protein [Gammaproteobacteria bacterium]MCE7897483.1 hypothetical protein [Gammaproteobacteria bacterium PRO8]MCL4776465.1 hypothetical protein [Gammaproteobacteria bacterium]MDL1881604.1 hypothetical protein [Gammaproteobacteria bacterium PRO2]GIK34613.1 MAG: hypothetical protein BroJett010_11720 [Gammaproteobacteria bacterium]
MYGAFIFMGALFGVALSVTVGLFYVLSLGGDFQASLRDAAGQLRDRITGRRRYQPQVTGERRVETDNRVRSLQEELRVANRLLEQARGEREANDQQARQGADQVRELQQAVLEREERILALESQVGQYSPQLQELREQLAERTMQLVQAQRQARDLQMEIEVLNSGVDVVSQ